MDARRLQALAREGDAGGVAALLKGAGRDQARAWLSAQNAEGMTPAHIAAERGDLATLEAVVRADAGAVHARDVRDGQPSLEAAAAGHLECLRWLVKKGADVNSSDQRGDTALHLAAGYGHLEMIKWLLANGAEVDARTKIDVTPLLYATARGQTEAVRLLLAAGADAFARDTGRGWNAIHTAAGCNQAAMLLLLANERADLLTSLSRDGKSAATVAREEGCLKSFVACRELCARAEGKVGAEVRRKEAAERGRRRAEADVRARQRALEDAARIERELGRSQKRPPGQKNKGRKKGRRPIKPAGPVPEQRRDPASDEAEEAEEVGRDSEIGDTPEKGADREEHEQTDVRDAADAAAADASAADAAADATAASPCPSNQELDEAEDGEWEVQVSRREKQRKKRSRDKQSSGESSSCSGDSGTLELQIPGSRRKSSCESRWTLGDEGVAQGQAVEETPESNLRPHAPPWSPRRRRWTSKAANAGQAKVKVLVDEPPGKVENEFQRMLKRFVHMDTGARRTAKRKFAKATKDYEEKRLADAEELERSWRSSVRQRLIAGIEGCAFKLLESTLHEIDEAEEARCLHDEKQQQGAAAARAPAGKVLAEDPALCSLVERAKLALAPTGPAPLQGSAERFEGGLLVRMPSVADVDEDEEAEAEAEDEVDESERFAADLRRSLQVWRAHPEQAGRNARLSIPLDRSALVPVAQRLGFDFATASPGELVMQRAFHH